MDHTYNSFKIFFENHTNPKLYDVKYHKIKLPNGTYRMQQEDWREFPIGSLYGEGDIHRFILTIHRGFEDDHRVNGVYQLKWVNPIHLMDSEWYIDDDKVQSMISSDTNMPPIVVNKDGDVVDGGHRLMAAKKTKKNRILAFIQQ